MSARFLVMDRDAAERVEMDARALGHVIVWFKVGAVVYLDTVCHCGCDSRFHIDGAKLCEPQVGMEHALLTAGGM